VARIAVVGPGAIGGTVAALLAQRPEHALQLCARTPFDGLIVETPHGLINAHVPVVTDPSAASPVDWVLVATKTYDAAGAARWFPALVGPETRVAILQNGVEHVERFTPWLERDRIVPAVVDIPAERAAPGRIAQRVPGTILVPAGADGDAFVALFAGVQLGVSTTEDFATALWRKLAINSAGVVSAVVMRPAEIAHDEKVAALMRALVAECIAVGRAEGATLDDDLGDAVVGHYRAMPGDSINSIHADRIAGRPTEIDARSRVVERIGARHGIAAPLNALMATLVEAASAHPAG
jgi:2-dehydropantoate 2-reductase